MTLIKLTAFAICISTLGIAQQLQEQKTPSSNSANQPETDTATVEKVFKGEDDGFQFIAYQITYHGKQVIIEDPTCISDYSIGEKIRFIVCRNDMTKTHDKGKKLIAFIIHKTKA